MNKDTTEDCSYLKAPIITSKHPGKPLDGTVVAMHTSHDVDIEEPLFGDLMDQAEERFEVNSYAEGLRLATVYFDAFTRDLVGMQWEESPRPFDSGDFAETVESLPDDFTPLNVGD